MSDFSINPRDWGVTLRKYTGPGGDIVVPDGVTEIEPSAFAYGAGITSITFPESLRSVEGFAFAYCTGLTSITFPKSLERIGTAAFEHCTELTTITFANSTVEDDGAEFSDGVIIDSYAFLGCTSLISVTFPKQLRWLCVWNYTSGPLVGAYPHCAFKDCTSLTSITLPEGVEAIGFGTFEECSGLTGINLPDTLQFIGPNAFAGCTSLRSLSLPAGLLDIDDGAYYGCEHLTSLSFPDSLPDINWYAFLDCAALDSSANVGLDKDGAITYDLGGRMVTARLQKDFSLRIEGCDGQMADTLPRDGADSAKYAAAAEDFADRKMRLRVFLEVRSRRLEELFLSGGAVPSDTWRETNLSDPLARRLAGLLVWAQGDDTFTLDDTGAPIRSDGTACQIGTGEIRLAHPMDMKKQDVEAWKRYFQKQGIRQPFIQMWEPIRNPEGIKENRYERCVLPCRSFMHKQRYGVDFYDRQYTDSGYDDSMEELFVGFGFLHSHACEEMIHPDDRLELFDLSFEKYSRRVSGFMTYLDHATLRQRIPKDDLSVMEIMDSYGPEEVTAFIRIAGESGAYNVLTALLNYSAVHFPEEITLSQKEVISFIRAADETRAGSALAALLEYAHAHFSDMDPTGELMLDS